MRKLFLFATKPQPAFLAFFRYNMEWLGPLRNGLWWLLVGLVVGVLIMRIRAARRKPRYVEFAGEGVGEEKGRWWVSIEVPPSRKMATQPIRLEWRDADAVCGWEWEGQLEPGIYTQTIKPQGTPGKCSVRLTAPGIRAERYMIWNGESLHPVGHFDAEQPHG
jgi:hypothetical protein